jgi:hypothetical protein
MSSNKLVKEIIQIIKITNPRQFAIELWICTDKLVNKFFEVEILFYPLLFVLIPLSRKLYC